MLRGAVCQREPLLDANAVIAIPIRVLHEVLLMLLMSRVEESGRQHSGSDCALCVGGDLAGGEQSLHLCLDLVGDVVLLLVVAVDHL